jgi:Flp pilus assembly protein TadD
VLDRYDEEIAAADREIGRLLSALAPVRHDTIVVVAGDHGEAFGEHGEYAHSIFVYDTTLRVPLLMEGPGAAGNDGSAPRVVGDAVTLADVAPTVARLLGIEMPDVDGIDVSPAIAGGRLPSRELYAESFAPLLEFGWAPLRALRAGTWKFIAAPTPELFDLAHDPGEQTNVAAGQAPVAARLGNRVDRYAGADLPGTSAPNPAAAERLRALGYSAGARRETGTARPDPKDRREMAARIALVTSGELTGPRLATALESIVRDDPRNGQAHLRLGFARLQTGDCARAEPEFHAAIASGVPSVDPYLGLATCLGRRNDLQGAARALAEARRLEPASPILAANEGILHAATGDLPAAITSLQAALAGDPDLHEARFNLALAYAKSGRRADAAAAARDLLQRLPARSPQRAEVERLLRAVQ